MNKYGFKWSDGAHPLEIEFYMIRTKVPGPNLLQHYLNARSMIWPNRYRHRWTELLYREFLSNRFTVLMGAASTQKSSHAAEFMLLEYWASPQNTCVLISSTTRDKLESAVWGEVKMLWKEGTQRFEFLAGHILETKMAITTDDVEEDDIRDFRRGIVCKPCYVGHQNVGLGVFAGIKQERFRFLCDELQFMQPTFLDCLPNMSANTGSGGLKIIGSGNPDHNPDSQLGVAAEPKSGWSSVEEVEKTTVWETNFYGGRCVNLIGIDSPNFDFPEGKEPYPRLIGREFEKIIAHDYGRNSPQYETQVMGRMRISLAHARVITRELCRQHRAHDKVVWVGSKITKVKGLDPAYGTGDRCVAVDAEFGADVDGKIIFRIVGYKSYKLNVKLDISVEDQIAKITKEDADAFEIPYENIGWDSTGKGTVGGAFARYFGANSPIPLDSGGKTSDRPVRMDLFITDPKTGTKRHKKCSEHYSKRVSEWWFSMREAIESGQVRELPVEIMTEGCAREYSTVNGDKIEIEPKADMRIRLGRSPDLFDATVIALEMARQKGFQIERLGKDVSVAEKNNWLKDLKKKRDGMFNGKSLKSA